MDRREYLRTIVAGSPTCLAGCFSTRSTPSPGLVTCRDGSTQTPADSTLGPVNGTWPAPHFDARNTGHDPDGTGPGNCPTTQWTFDVAATSELFLRAPVVADGTVFVGRESVYALDAASGDISWQTSAPRGLAGPLATADGTVYTANGNGVFALDATNGDATTLTTVSTDTLGAPTVVDETLYVGTDAGALVAVGLVDGLRWRTDLTGGGSDPPGLGGKPAVADDVVDAGSEDGTVHAVDAVTGEIRWQRSTPGTLWDAVVVGEDLVYAPDQTSVTAFRRSDGTEEWTLFDDGGYVTGSPALARGTLYVQAGPSLQEAQIRAVDAATGETRWARNVETPETSPVVIDDRVYFGAGSDLVALDTSGDRRWRVDPRDDIHAPAVVVDGVVYLTATGTSVLAVA